MIKKMSSKEATIMLSTIILLILGSSLLGYIYFRNQPQVEPITNNTTNSSSEFKNGAFINIWIDTSNVLKNLQNHNITLLIVDVGHVNPSGVLETTDKEITDFIKLVNDYERNNNYQFELQPYSELILENYNFNSNFQRNVIQDYVRLNNLGFDGASVDIEAIPEDKRQDYLNFLDRLRTALPGKTISAYAGMINNDNPNDWEWTYNYFKQVASKADIIMISTYDFNIRIKQDYEDYLSGQLRKITSETLNAKLMLTVPTHKRVPETISNALEVLNKETEAKSKFYGIMIFAEWTTDREEWKVFEEFVKNN